MKPSVHLLIHSLSKKYPQYLLNIFHVSSTCLTSFKVTVRTRSSQRGMNQVGYYREQVTFLSNLAAISSSLSTSWWIYRQMDIDMHIDTSIHLTTHPHVLIPTSVHLGLIVPWSLKANDGNTDKPQNEYWGGNSQLCLEQLGKHTPTEHLPILHYSSNVTSSGNTFSPSPQKDDFILLCSS